MWDDAFRVGEYIDTGRLKGTVETLGIRSVKLRHQNGPLHTIPYGQLGAVTNLSRDFATIKFNLRLRTRHRYRARAQDGEADRPRRCRKKPEIAAEVMLPLKMQGIAEVTDNARRAALQVHRAAGQAELDAARISEADVPGLCREGDRFRLGRVDAADRAAAAPAAGRRGVAPSPPQSVAVAAVGAPRPPRPRLPPPESLAATAAIGGDRMGSACSISRPITASTSPSWRARWRSAASSRCSSPSTRISRPAARRRSRAAASCRSAMPIPTTRSSRCPSPPRRPRSCCSAPASA